MHVRDSDQVRGSWGMRDRVTVLIFDIEQSGKRTCGMLTVYIIGAAGNRQKRIGAA